MPQGCVPLLNILVLIMLNYLNELKSCLAKLDLNAILQIIMSLKNAKRRIIFVLGNGGSQANASHLALHLTQAGYRVKDIMADLPLLTALSNDFAYSETPQRILEKTAKAGDVLFVFSCSGKSPNIINALTLARKLGMITFGCLGTDGGRAKSLCSQYILVPSSEYGIIEDAHSTVLHLFDRELKRV